MNSIKKPACMYKKNSFNKCDLTQLNDEYLKRMEQYLQAAVSMEVPVVIDAWDGWRGRADYKPQYPQFSVNPLNPANNVNDSFDLFKGLLIEPTTIFPFFYEFENRPEIAKFQQRHLENLVKIVGKYSDWVKISTGNEMCFLEENKNQEYEELRWKWHAWTAGIIKKLDSSIDVYVNECRPYQNHEFIAKLVNDKIIDCITYHGCGVLYSPSSEKWDYIPGGLGILNMTILPVAEKVPVILDNDGIGGSRDKPKFVAEWGNLVWKEWNKETLNDYGAKGPFPGDTHPFPDRFPQEQWDPYGIDCLRRLNNLLE